MATLLALQVIVLLASVLVYRRYFRKGAGPSLPPGPAGLPIVGNIKDLPPGGVPEYQHWLKHKDAYGPISSVTVMGQTLVILHDKKAALDLMEKNSLRNSSRPTMEFAFDMCGFGHFISSQGYNDTHRRYRKFAHQQLGTRALSARFNDLQEVEVQRFLLRVLEDPQNLMAHFKTEAGAIILKMTYGYTIEPQKADPLVELINRVMVNFSLATVPGAWLVDFVPALKYLPNWFPGAGFKETARRWHKINMAMADVPYAFVRRQMDGGSGYMPSYVSNLVQQIGGGERPQLSPDDEHAIKWTAASLYAGGADTTVSSLMFFALAMVLFPDVQRRAQEEIDRVVGTGRLPRFADREKLPYVEAVVLEAFRWHHIAPMGLPHVTEEDAVYAGYLIPKGSLLLPTMMWYAHDPEVYRDPEEFDPERYFPPRNEPDPRDFVFGFGRRICPGRHLAESSVFLTVAQTLTAFDITRAVDEKGEEMDVKVQIQPGIITHPVDFPFSISPRSAKHAELIRKVEIDHPWEESGAVHLDCVHVKE